MIDKLIKNGTVVDGTGAPPYRADIAVDHGKIVGVAEKICSDAVETLDIEGRYISPGFIDFHSHADLTLTNDLSMQILLRQGVTSCVGGLCGLSLSPYSDRYREIMYQSSVATRDVPELRRALDSVYDFRDLLKFYSSLNFGVNMALFTGLGNLRASVRGFEMGAAEPQEIAEMEELLDTALSSGALGLSAGFVYPPDIYVGDAELERLLRVVARHGGIFNVHMRSEGDLVTENVENYISMCRRAGCRLHISHHKAAGRRNWGKSAETLRLIENANSEGFPVTMDVYPYTASCSTLKNIIPARYCAGGMERLLEQLMDRERRAEIREAVLYEAEEGENQANIGFDNILVMLSSCKSACGKSIASFAKETGQDPLDTALDLLIEDGGTTMVAYFSMSEQDVNAIISSPYSCFGTDGAVFGPGDSEHPRCSSTFIRVLEKLVKREKLLTLEQAVHKASMLPAEIAGLKGKGRIANGFDADLTVFNLDTVHENATYVDMNIPNCGIELVLSGGETAVRDDVFIGVFNGKILLNSKERQG